MLVDAPAHYSPFWLDHLQDENLKAHLTRLHRRLRKEVARGGKVTLMRDLILRRIVYSVRILERLEQAIDLWDARMLASTHENAEELLIEYMRFYDYHSKSLVRMVNFVLDSDFDKGVTPSSEEPTREKSRVVIPKI